MSARSLSDASGAPAAINAFLRGIERRGAVFAQLQCGDPNAGDAALAAAMRAFHASAAHLPMGDWPRRFWSLLLATPMLRQSQPLPMRAGALAPLGQVGHGPRAALLLRLAAGLDEADAAAALGIASATYRLALQRALPRRGDGAVDAEAWRSLALAVQAAIRGLPPQRLAHLARLRESALQPVARGAAASLRAALPVAKADNARPRWLPATLWAALTLCLLVLAVSFLWPRPRAITPAGQVDVRTESLPEAEAPASRFDAHTALLSDRDFELLLDAGDENLYRQLDFLAWYAAQSTTGPAPAAGSTTTKDAAETAAQDPGNEPETSDATL